MGGGGGGGGGQLLFFQEGIMLSREHIEPVKPVREQLTTYVQDSNMAAKYTCTLQCCTFKFSR